jgi:ADP-ribosylglycohydrolase
MMGAIAGDIIGSYYESNNIKIIDFYPLFSQYAQPTDDTVMTVAVAEWILDDGEPDALVDSLKKWFHYYPAAGYGMTFFKWCSSNLREPYNSWGNGSAMRVSPVGFAFKTLEEVLIHAELSAAVTHNHPEGIKGAQATAAAIFLARTGNTKEQIREYIESTFGYDLSRSLDEIRSGYTFDVSCQGSVPQAIRALLESENYEDAVRKAISLGGDSDTIACITGGIAQAYFGGVPDDIRAEALARMGDDLRRVLDRFEERFR